MSPEQYKDWLEDDTAMRCILVEATVKLEGVETPLLLSNRGFTTSPTDTPPNTAYISAINGGVSVSETISLKGNASISYGDIEVENNEGEFDSWLDGVWVNREVKVMFGDLSWPRTEFNQVFVGVIANIDSKSRNRLNIKFRDKLQRLNTPVTEEVLGGETDNKERLLPVLFGEAHNIEPLLIDPANHEYKFNTGSSERIIEVRDDGVPVEVVATLSAGTFRLVATPKGQITMSAQGSKAPAYSDRVTDLIKLLAMSYGKASERFTLDDIDSTALDAFNTSHPQALGVYLSDKANVLEVCQRLASSLGAMVTMSRSGLFKILQVSFPVIGTPFEVTVHNMVKSSLRIASRSDVAAAVKLNYCKNWTVQTNLDTGIPEQHKDLFMQEWIVINQEDAAVADEYRLHSTPDEEDTMLLAEADASAEALRRLSIRKVQRTVFQFEGFADCLTLELGGAVRITHPRFGLSSGKVGMVVNLQPDWMKSRCSVQVMI